ncbi:MAG: phenylalanine--tRNA ligase subunit beta [Kiritimatiellae bacterium]|nr:phenylalanine--tRNA ligase subunit beta [Kiritimatiellia bacterium]
MKIPLSWLHEYVEFDDTVEGLCDKLTFSGIEVEAVERTAEAPKGVVAAKITAIADHPDSDHLHLCTVEYGAEAPLTIVCGAPNVAVGMVAPLAPLGTELPGGFKIERRKVRGVESCGMLCAADELGLSADHSGLMPLPPDTVPGTPLADLLPPPETVIEVEITPNRGDELSMVGVAREVAALYHSQVKLPAVDFEESAATPVESLASVDLQDATDCPRYTARVFENVRIVPAPDWMQRRLAAAGVRPINNVVDISNYVMLELGQPLHTFDYDLLAGHRIVVRHPAPGEGIMTLDGVERPLAPEMLAICDAEKPMAVAGVMGGEHSGIADGTTRVLLEAATFRPAAIRATSKQLALASESSYRYVRGVPADLADFASRRAAHLLQRYAGATVAAGAIDCWPAPKRPWPVTCRLARLQTLLGVKTTIDEMERIFNALGLATREKTADAITVEIPTFREDLTREADLCEEFVRIYGLKNLPPVRPVATLVEGADDAPFQAKQRLREALVGLGLQEAMNYSFTADALLDRFDAADAPRRVKLLDPLGADHAVMRTSLLPQLVENIGLNVSRQVSAAALFEIGRTFALGADGVPVDTDHLGIALLGPAGRIGLGKYQPYAAADMFLWLKGLWESLADALSLRGVQMRPADAPFAMPALGLDLYVEGKKIGHLGILKPEIARHWRILQPVGVLEAALAPLLRVPAARRTLVPPPAYPSTSRDIALIVDTAVRHEQVLKIARKAAPPELESVELFDIYQGKNLPAGKKSMAYSFTYRSKTGTLTDDQANAFQQKITAALLAQLPATLREM